MLPRLLLTIQLIHLQARQTEAHQLRLLLPREPYNLSPMGQHRKSVPLPDPTITSSPSDVLHALPAGCLGPVLPFLATELSFQSSCFVVQVEKAGDVIAFYNQVFVPEVKPSLMRLHQARATLPRPPTLSTTNPFTSPVRVQSRLEFPANGFSTPPPANRWAMPCHV